MKDSDIIEMFWNRNEQAITETDKIYRNYLVKIAYNILNCIEDSQEVLNDTYLRVWTSIPDNRPDNYSAYLSRITRCLAIDRYRRKNGKKRGGGSYDISLDELSECIGSQNDPQTEAENTLLAEALNRFLDNLPKTKRDIFMCRYYFADSIEYISKTTGYSQSKIKSILFRTRKQLAELLRKEGFTL